MHSNFIVSLVFILRYRRNRRLRRIRYGRRIRRLWWQLWRFRRRILLKICHWFNFDCGGNSKLFEQRLQNNISIKYCLKNYIFVGALIYNLNLKSCMLCLMVCSLAKLERGTYVGAGHTVRIEFKGQYEFQVCRVI